jgi:hypothetical protein
MQVNENTSDLLAVDVSVGVDAPAHLTLTGQVTALLPPASCFNTSIKDLPVVAAGNVNVIEALPSVRYWIDPFTRSIV